LSLNALDAACGGRCLAFGIVPVTKHLEPLSSMQELVAARVSKRSMNVYRLRQMLLLPQVSRLC
jgi:hypothetical protein